MKATMSSGVLVLYIICGIGICAWFYSAVSSGGTMLSFGAAQANRPMGPGQHFHK